MSRRLLEYARGPRGLVLALGLIAAALPVGCAKDGYDGKEFSQEFEKPADYPTKSIEEKDTYPDEEQSPRERRGALNAG